MEFPLGLFGIALATVTLPYLSRQYLNESYDEFAATLDWSMKLVTADRRTGCGRPDRAGRAARRNNILWRCIHEDDVRMTALALQAFAVGLVGFSFVKILAPAYFAREDTRTPVRIGLIALAVNFVLSVTLAWYLTSIGYAGTHAGLALAISVAAMLNAYLLFRGLRKQDVLKLSRGWGALLLQALVANAVMTIALVYVDRPLSWWLAVGVPDRSTWLGISILAGAAAYFLVLFGLGLRPSKLGLRPH